MTLEFQLTGGKKINLTYQEAELMYKDLQRIFGQPQAHFRPLMEIGRKDPGYPTEVPGTWCRSNPVGIAVAHEVSLGACSLPISNGGCGEFKPQKEALAERYWRGEAH